MIALLTKKAAGVESGGLREGYSVDLVLDRVDPLVADLLVAAKAMTMSSLPRSTSRKRSQAR